MADLTITAANVAKVSGNTMTGSVAGETITAGQSVYLKASDGKWYKAQCDGTTEESGSGTTLGIALHGSLAGQPLAVLTDGVITIGATLVAGTQYVVSATAGGIAPWADLVSTNKYSSLGYASSTTQLTLRVNATNIALA